MLFKRYRRAMFGLASVALLLALAAGGFFLVGGGQASAAPGAKAPPSCNTALAQAPGSAPNNPETRVTSEIKAALGPAAANSLGITTEQLRRDVVGGQSFAGLAAAHHVTLQQVEDAVRVAGEQVLTAAVRQGTITQAQADSLSQTLITDQIDNVILAKSINPAERSSSSQAKSTGQTMVVNQAESSSQAKGTGQATVSNPAPMSANMATCHS